MLRIYAFRINGRVVRVGLRPVRTPYLGYIVEFDDSTALIEVRNGGVVLRTAYGKWDVDILKAVKDYIQTK